MLNESTTPLFALPANSALLRRFVLEIDALPSDSVVPTGLLANLSQVINLMIANPDKFDELASSNVQWIGDQFIQEIKDYLAASSNKQPSSIQSIFVGAYRFLCELEFTQVANPSFEVRKVINFVHTNLNAFDGSDRQQLIYAAYAMPAELAKKLINHPSVIEFRRFSETVEESRKLKERWDSELGQRLGLLEGLADNLKKVTSEYNFVGLVNGFRNLKTQKTGERDFSFRSLVVLGIAMIALPGFQVHFVMNNLEEIERFRQTLIYSLPTILTLEIVLLYFFRVVLTQFRSVKAQLLQVDLRISLCQFIESYADYVSRLRQTDSSALSKFEALIFSGLVTDESGIPSTFDGVEQIASLVRSVRGTPKE